MTRFYVMGTNDNPDERSRMEIEWDIVAGPFATREEAEWSRLRLPSRWGCVQVHPIVISDG